MRAADVAELLKGLAIDVREFVAKSMTRLEERFAALEQRLHEIPLPLTAEEVLADGRIARALAETVTPSIDGLVKRLGAVEERAPVPGPKGDNGGPGPRGDDGEPGVDGLDGKSIDEAALQLRIDAAVDLRVGAAVAKAVSEAMAALALPKDGRDGTDGKDGTDGQDGEDVDDVALESRIEAATTRAVAAAVAAIPVPSDGTDGKDGRDVDEEALQRRVDEAVRKTVAESFAAIAIPKDGVDGKDGRDVDEEALQRRVDTAVDRTLTAAVAAIPVPKDGVDGKDGEDGKDGVDGRDALQIELLDAIDPAKSYPRGTYARWKGGSVRSFRATDALVDGEPIEKAGWSLSQDGLASIEVQSGDDPRDIIFRATLTSGKTVEHAMSVPTPIWRGTWTPECNYRRGCEVTYDGSIWHCERPTKAKPGTQTSAPDWKLCVKRGRDGKDGDKGPKGDRGDDGRPGRDLTQLGWDGSKT